MSELENNQATGEQVQTLPVLPLKNTLLFPQLVLPLAVGRPSSVKAVEAVLATEDKEVILVAQREPTVENPGQGDLYTIGTRAVVRKMNRQPDGSMELLVLGMERVVLLKL